MTPSIYEPEPGCHVFAAISTIPHRLLGCEMKLASRFLLCCLRAGTLFVCDVAIFEPLSQADEHFC